MRASIFLVVPFAVLALGQTTTNSGGAVTSQSLPSTIQLSPSSLPSVSTRTAVISSVAVNSTVTTGSARQTTTATTSAGTQTGAKTTASTGTAASTARSTGAAAGMIQPAFSLGLAGVIFAALF